MSNKRLLHMVTALLLTTQVAAMAQEPPSTATSALSERPVLAMFTAAVGHASLLDTYLTSIRYKGLNLELGFEHLQNTGFNPQHWTRQLTLGVEYDNVDNRVGNNTMHAIMADGQWALMHRWQWPAKHIKVLAGPMTQLRAGVIYNAANSNNVVAVKARWSLGITAMACFDTRLARKPLTLRYQASLPVAGVFFSPHYDESYYEMYLGNRKNLAHLGWWGNRFDLTHQLLADWHLGGTIVRLGYRGHFETSWVNNLSTKIYTHSLVVGIGGEFLTVKRK